MDRRRGGIYVCVEVQVVRNHRSTDASSRTIDIYIVSSVVNQKSHRDSQGKGTIMAATNYEKERPCVGPFLCPSLLLSTQHRFLLTPLQEVAPQFWNSKLDRRVRNKESHDSAHEDLDVSRAWLREIAPFDDDENLGRNCRDHEPYMLTHSNIAATERRQ